MLHILTFLTFIILQSANAQFCVPEPVKNVTFDKNYTLYWQPSTNCEEQIEYIIYIHFEDDLQYLHTTSEPYLDASFLPSCERFYFLIRAKADNALSTEVRLSWIIPAPPDTDLTITSLRVSKQEESTFLQWQVPDKYAHCARSFRVVIEDEFNPPRDVYTTNNFLFINNLIPCSVYWFSVRAIYDLASEGPVTVQGYFSPAIITAPPVLENVTTTDTYIDVSWRLPPVTVNKCSIHTFEIESLPYYQKIYPIDDTIQRPAVFTTRIGPLEPESMYILRAYIINVAGPSDAYSVGVQTRPRNG